ncbi:MAG: Dipeptidyl-peptidase 5 [Gemmatimonadaceae bacterium]|nr:Dipeptidyl-peptidase 5 [Gemmatimonadaceae bacterium]
MKVARSASLTAGTLVALCAGTTLPAQQPLSRIAVEQYLDWEEVQAPQLSPDGTQIVFTRRWVDKLNDRWESSLWLMNADGSRQRALVQGANVQWSPDGKRIAYIAKGEPSGSQIWVRWMDAEGATTQISRLTESPSDIEWSPDGKSIAFTMMVPAPQQLADFRIPMPSPPKGAKWVDPPKIVTRIAFRSDRIGFTDEGYRQIFVIPADGGTPRQVTSGDWNASAPNYSADSKWVAFSSYRVPDADRAWIGRGTESEIYLANTETAEIRRITHHPGSDNNPVFSPDGKYIAFMSADSIDHSAWPDTRLMVMNADGSGRRTISGNLDRPMSGVRWAPDASGVYFNVQSEGTENLYFASVAGQVRPVTTGTHMLNVSDISGTGVAVGTRATSLRPGDVVTFAIPKTGAASALTQLTNVNDDVLAGKSLAQTEEVWYTSSDGLRIQGWIVKPPGFDPQKQYPLILEIHGGPQAMFNVSFNYARQLQAAEGYVVLYTNPRGSTGYGNKFTDLIRNAYPGKDFDDLMAGVDTVVGRGYVDAKNMFVYGCSGGGVLTAWVVGHTDRFAAAASLCPVINWMSFVGQTDGAGWYQTFEKPFWEDPSEYLTRSPIMYVGNVKTPTILMTGILDLRTPMPQSEEFYRALKYRGVPSALIRFNNEYHGTTSTPSNFLRTHLYLRAWFDKYSTRPTVRATSSDGTR